MGAESFFFLWVWRQGLVINELGMQRVSGDKPVTYPLMVLVAFEILQSNSYLYGVVVGLQSRQLVDQICPVTVTANGGSILHASAMQLRSANDAYEQEIFTYVMPLHARRNGGPEMGPGR